MDSSELQQLATRSRTTRESGITILFASGVLALLFFIPHVFSSTEKPPSSPITIATSTAPDAFAHITTQAHASIVYDLITGETLYEQNADAQLPLASLTKLLTVYAALSFLSPTTPVTISPEATQVEAPKAFFVGQTFSLSDLARLTLTASLNDGAAAIAEATATSENRSQREMIAGVAEALNLSQTYAVNGSGLDVSTEISGGYGSARDLARLSGALVAKAPEIARATTQSTTQANSLGGTSFSVKNTDPIVGTLPRLLLSKTGYTDLAGGNLALVFDAGIAHPIAVVVLGSSKEARFTDASALVFATLAHFAGISSL
jgi:D-alanyl-D-alanine carboxypeptidase (penicillin-binding protein 5/6)